MQGVYVSLENVCILTRQLCHRRTTLHVTVCFVQIVDVEQEEKRGPSTASCGTPDGTGASVDLFSSTLLPVFVKTVVKVGPPLT